MKYDNSKSYGWDPQTQFVITGEQFAEIINGLKQILSTPEAQTILLAYRAYSAIEEVLKENVENEIVKELNQEENG